MQPGISVVMPTWNRGQVIQHAIRSVIDQTYKNWELVIIDDGSTDSTERIVKNFAHPRIVYRKIEHQNNISRVRNIGNQLAKADIIVVHDSDDMAMPERLEEIDKAFKDNPEADIVYHGTYIRAFDSYHNTVSRLIRDPGEYSKKRLLTEQYIPGQIAYKKSVAMEIPYDERVPIMDDYVFLVHLACQDKKFHYLNKRLYEYWMGNDSINMIAEANGTRKREVETLLDIMRTDYGLTVSASMFKKVI